MKLIITRGLPSSGKTTYANKFVEDNPNFVRISRDDLRGMLFNHLKQTGQMSFRDEKAVTVVQRAIVTSLLKGGRNVICDDTNVRARYVTEWAKFASKLNAEFEVVEIECSVDEAIERNTLRHVAGEEYVDPAVIRNMAKYLDKQGKFIPWKPVEKINAEPYVAPAGPKAVLVDIDGTTALMQDRDPYDWSRVGGDKPNMQVIDTFKALAKTAGARIIFVSGREDVCLEETKQWLVDNKAVDGDWLLYMRPAGDKRPDAEFKLEAFNKYIRNNYNVIAVFDDRDSVVRLWRDLGLTTFQVNYGDF